MSTKNEADPIITGIMSLWPYDEALAVNDSSTDNTVEIAKAAGAHIVIQPYCKKSRSVGQYSVQINSELSIVNRKSRFVWCET